jgi:heat shock protein HtpX
MWEAIQSNRRKSVVLVFAMLLVLLALGAALGGSLGGMMSEASQEGIFGGLFLGMAVASGLWFLLTAISIAQGDSILLRMSGAREIEKEDHPQLVNVVEEMTIAAQLPARPRIYIIDDMGMNAFATGKSPDKSAVAITAGLLARLNRDQLQGVIAHEIAHVKNEDIKYMTRLSIMLGVIVMVSELFLRSVFHAGASRRYGGGSKSKGQGHIVFLLIAIVFAILAPILGQLILLASSRQREYLADASAAIFTRFPEGLASALELLGGHAQLQKVSKATAPLYIVSPLKGGNALHGWFSTHPPIAQRVQILRTMAGGVSFAGYQTAWNQASGKEAGHIPPSALTGEKAQAIREPNTSATSGQDTRGRMRETGDLLRRMNEFLFLSCVCGMRIKLPPEFKHDHVDCPRCKRTLEVPVAQLAALHTASAAMAGQGGQPGLGALPLAQGGLPTATAKHPPKPEPGEKPLEVYRDPNTWTSFKCRCGKVKNVGPSFSAPQVQCAQCGRNIFVKNR